MSQWLDASGKKKKTYYNFDVSIKTQNALTPDLDFRSGKPAFNRVYPNQDAFCSYS
jgi:hypothetical protein